MFWEGIPWFRLTICADAHGFVSLQGVVAVPLLHAHAQAVPAVRLPHGLNSDKQKVKSTPEALNQNIAWNPVTPDPCTPGLLTNSSKLLGRSLLNHRNSYQLSQELHWAILCLSVQNMNVFPVPFNTILHCHSLEMIFWNYFQLSEADNMLSWTISYTRLLVSIMYYGKTTVVSIGI